MKMQTMRATDTVACVLLLMGEGGKLKSGMHEGRRKKVKVKQKRTMIFIIKKLQ